MTLLRQDFVSGTLSADLPQSGGGSTTFQSPGLTTVVAVAGPDVMRIVLDPFGVNGPPEQVDITAHSASSNSATILRSQRGTNARLHPASTVWVNAVVAQDLIDFQAQLDNQFHTSIFTAAGDSLFATAANVPARVAVGSEYQAITGASAQASKVQWRALPVLCTSGARPTSGVFVGLHIFETDTGHTLSCIGVGPTVWHYVDEPPGTYRFSASPNAKHGELACDGGAYDPSTYPALFAEISTTYGGDGITTFVVPNFNGRFAIGVDGTHTVGSPSGSFTKTLSEANLAPHNHGGTTGANGGHSHTGTTSIDPNHDHGGTVVANGAHFHPSWIGNTNQSGATSHQHAFVAQRVAMGILGGSNNPAPGDPSNDMSVPVNIGTVAAHSHVIDPDGTHQHTLASVSTAPTHQHTIAIDGSAAPFDITPPYQAVYVFIRI